MVAMSITHIITKLEDSKFKLHQRYEGAYYAQSLF